MHRYVFALVVSILVIACGFLFAARARSALFERVRQQFREAQAAGTLPPELKDVDVETLEFSDLGVELSEDDLRRLSAADFLTRMWFVWVPTVLVVCFGIAAMWPRKEPLPAPRADDIAPPD